MPTMHRNRSDRWENECDMEKSYRLEALRITVDVLDNIILYKVP